MSGAPKVIGVVGAGTMGSGIAQLGALSGARTLLFDADAGAVERALERIPQHLDRGAERGRWSAEDAAGARDRLAGAGELADLAECELDRRSRPRVARPQARAVRVPLGDRALGRPRLEHLVDPDHLDRARRGRPLARRRDALLQPAAADEARRGHRRARVVRGRARDRPCRGRGDGQARHRRRRRPRLPRQPLQSPVRPRGAEAARRACRRRRDDRPHLPPRRRLPDGPLRAVGPRRRRRRLRDRASRSTS